MSAKRIDIAILGGGLAGGLIALALAKRRPELSVLLVEAEELLGGNHVWSFFSSDIDSANASLVDTLIERRWTGYEVHFPAHSRVLTTAYNSATSERLDSAVRSAFPHQALLTGTAVSGCDGGGFSLTDGRSISAGAVIDARGAHSLPHMRGGWQKFAGRMLRLAQPHGLDRPIVMDARVEQVDGYRFVYCLPFSERDVFVEDTYYSDSPDLDLPTLHGRIDAYAADHGWSVAEVSRDENGVLPVIGSGDFEAFWSAGETGTARAGTRAALVHPLTSYSLPDAVRFAATVAQLPDVSGAALAKASYACAKEHWRRGYFYRMLSTMLFAAAAPTERYRMLERFYRLPEPLIERFYAGRSTLADKARILAGKPPVPIGAAIKSLAGKGLALAPLGRTA